MITMNLQTVSGSRIGALAWSTEYVGEEYDQRGVCWCDPRIVLAPGKGGGLNDVLAEFTLRYTKTGGAKVSRIATLTVRG